MSSKAFVFLGLLFAFVLLISSEVAARDLAETSTEKNNEAISKTNGGLEDDKHGGGGYDRGHDDRGYGRGGYDHGGRGNYGGGGRGGYDHGGRYGGGGGGRCYHGRCGYRCCSYAGEVVEAEKP